jgi:hypothetical protein
MFCIECGQAMADEAKFCAYCGTRRAVLPPAGDVAGARVPSAKSVEQPVSAPPPTIRPVRSTAEIMPIRMPSAPSVPPPPPPRRPVVAATPPEAVTPVVIDQGRPPHAVETNEAPFEIEPAVVDEGSGWSTSAPVPNDAYPPGGLFHEDVAARPVGPAEPAVPRVKEPVRPAPLPYTAVPFAAADYAADVAPARRKISPVLIGALLVALIAIAGIAWMLRSSMSVGGKAASKVEVTMFPTTAKVVAGKGIDVAATVTGAPSSEVTWSVEEGADTGQIQTRGAYAKEGAISLYATYTPKAPGTYHLVATSTADPSKSASAEITAVAK